MSHDEREFVSTGEPHASSPFSSARHPQGLSVNAKITGRIISKVVSLHEKKGPLDKSGDASIVEPGASSRGE